MKNAEQVEAAGRPRAQHFALWAASTYVHLFALEGALRKWLPGSESIMYVARDLFIIFAIIFAGLILGGSRSRASLYWTIFTALFCLAILQILFVDNSPLVAAVGLRSYIAPLLFVYLAFKYGTETWLTRIRDIISLYAVLNLVICAAQVISPPSSWINSQVGGEGAYFINAGIVRTSGLFSAPAGLTAFLPVAFALALTGLVQSSTRRQKILSSAATFAIALTSLISGSRGSLLAVLAVVVGYLVFCAFTGRFKLLVAIVLSSSLSFAALLLAFPAVLTSFLSRVNQASQDEDSGRRVLDQTVGFASRLGDWWGDGLGSHSQAGIAAGATGPWVETETLRWVAEMGFVGFVAAILRLVFVLWILLLMVRSDHRIDVQFMTMAAALIPTILYGQITQFPSAQAAMSIGLAVLLLSERSIRHPAQRAGAPRRQSELVHNL